MHEYDLILTLTGGLAAALVLGYVTQRVGLSPIVGYLLAGTLVGPHTPGFVAEIVGAWRGHGPLGDTKMRIVVLFAAAIVLACSTSAAQESRAPAKASITGIAWLAGDWVGETTAATFEERWTPPAGGAMLGVARTIEKDRMVGFEYLRIVERDGQLLYIAQPEGRSPTEFVLTSLAGHAATFENPEHDFPKAIRYTLRSDGMLEAQISDGGQRRQTFLFKRTR